MRDESGGGRANVERRLWSRVVKCIRVPETGCFCLLLVYGRAASDAQVFVAFLRKPFGSRLPEFGHIRAGGVIVLIVAIIAALVDFRKIAARGRSNRTFPVTASAKATNYIHN